MQLTEILPKLTDWFEPQDHKDRKLPGGGKWFYVPHQAIRDRLNEICPGEWHDEYKGPYISGDYTVMMCRLTICGVSREGIADDKTFPELNSDGKEKIIGSPVVNASRHAFRDAAEMFGIAAYLDEQKKSKADFIRYMSSKQDGRAYKAAADNGYIEPRPAVDTGKRSPDYYRAEIGKACRATDITNREMLKIASTAINRNIQSAEDIKSDKECIAICEAILNYQKV
jgi:hypothetical protein